MFGGLIDFNNIFINNNYMSLFNRIFNQQYSRIINCIKTEMPKNFLNMVSNEAIKATYSDKYLIFGIILQALEANMTTNPINQELYNKLLFIIHTSMVIVHHTYNLPEFNNVNRDSVTGINSIHIEYNESLSQLVLLLLSTKISETVLNLNKFKYFADGDIRQIDMKFIITIINKINDRTINIIDNDEDINYEKILKDVCLSDSNKVEIKSPLIKRLYKIKINQMMYFIFSVYYELFGNLDDEKKKILKELSDCMTTLYLYIYSNDWDDLSNPNKCEKNQEYFKFIKARTIELLVKLGLFNKNFQSIVLYFEATYLCKIRDTMKSNLNTNSFNVI